MGGTFAKDDLKPQAGYWRIGRRVPLNVYAGDRPVCQCHTAEDALAIVRAMNAMRDLREMANLRSDWGLQNAAVQVRRALGDTDL